MYHSLSNEGFIASVKCRKKRLTEYCQEVSREIINYLFLDLIVMI